MYRAFALHALLCVVIHTVSGVTELEEFENFMKQFNKVYKSPKEYQYRLSVFATNRNIARQMQKTELGTAEYGITEFSDLTHEEFIRNGLSSIAVPPNNVTQLKVEAKPVGDSCDWRKAGVISVVKDQGRCGSCWAFAAVANIEAQWGIVGYPMNLSVQQVLDCSPCQYGCKGGNIWIAYTTVMQQGGLAFEDDYPYEGLTLQCRSNRFKRVGYVYDFIMLTHNEDVMACYTMNHGTIVVSINAVLLQHYKNGVIQNSNCDPNYLNHAVLLVGYSKGELGHYWIVKNSWGKTWGENGFFRIAFGKNMCGITRWPLSAITTYPGSRSMRCPA
ncbi:cathepsin W-like [Eleutherodactylus coqui]|uniref:cathepsin W-like n=1 Tax=Eleutherodactylus coqui TaxID=57060 RepID=UPI0034629397